MSSNPGDAPAADASKQQQDTAAAAVPPAAAAGERELTDEEVAERHRAWMAEHGRVYADEAERVRRLGVFRDNMRYIEAHNRGGHSYTLGLNQFSDLTQEEFRATYCGGLLLPDDNPSGADQDDEGSVANDGPTPPPPPPEARRDP